MVISICGDILNKNILINKLKDFYKEDVVFYNYFNYKFKTIIETERYKYKYINMYDLDYARLKYKNLVNNMMCNKLNKFLIDNKNKLVVIVYDDVLDIEFYNSKYFFESDIKIYLGKLAIGDIKFDFVIENLDNFDVKRLVIK